MLPVESDGQDALQILLLVQRQFQTQGIFLADLGQLFRRGVDGQDAR